MGGGVRSFNTAALINRDVDQHAARLHCAELVAGDDVRRGGSAAIDLCHVAAGKLDGYWEMSLRPWDVAAGTLIAREAGARVTSFEGEEGFLDGRSVLAAAPGLYDAMLAVLREGRHGPA